MRMIYGWSQEWSTQVCEKACLKRKVLSWVLNSGRLGRFCRLAGNSRQMEQWNSTCMQIVLLCWCYFVSIMKKMQALWLTVKVYSQYSIVNHYNNVVYLVWNSFRHQGVKSCGRELSSIQNLMPFARWLQSKCEFEYAYMPWGPLLSLYL